MLGSSGYSAKSPRLYFGAKSFCQQTNRASNTLPNLIFCNWVLMKLSLWSPGFNLNNIFGTKAEKLFDRLFFTLFMSTAFGKFGVKF